MRTKSEWKLIFQKLQGNLHEYTLQIQANLLGYRKTSLHRATDADNLTNALEALTEEQAGDLSVARLMLQRIKEEIDAYENVKHDPSQMGPTLDNIRYILKPMG
jgi:hypothetical protein